MSKGEGASAECLWRYVVDLKYGSAGRGTPEAAAAAQASDFVELGVICDAVQSVLPREEAFGHAQARKQLVEALAGSRAAGPRRQPMAIRPPWRPALGRWRTSGAMIALLVVLTAIAIAAWFRAAAVSGAGCTAPPAKAVKVVGGAAGAAPVACPCRRHSA